MNILKIILRRDRQYQAKLIDNLIDAGYQSSNVEIDLVHWKDLRLASLYLQLSTKTVAASLSILFSHSVEIVNTFDIEQIRNFPIDKLEKTRRLSKITDLIDLPSEVTTVFWRGKIFTIEENS